MGPSVMARLVAGRLHYAWVVVAVMFVVILASVGVRATPGVLIVPLQQAFGWNAAVISGAVSLNILLFGLVGPFAAGLIQTIGLKRTVLCSMALLVIGAGLSSFVTEIWQLYLTWGVLVGLGFGRRDGRAGDGDRQPVVRAAARAGGGAADGEQCLRPVGFPAVAGEPGGFAQLAHRAAGGGRGDPGADPGGAADAAGKPGFDRDRAVRVGRNRGTAAAVGQPVRHRDRRADPRRPVGGFLAAVHHASRCAGFPPTGWWRRI